MIKDDKLTDVLGTLHKLTSAIFSDAIQRKLILDNLTEAVFTVDQDLKVTSFNKAAEVITGIEEKEALGKRCTELFDPSSVDDFCIIAEVLEHKRPLIKQTRQLRVDGRLVPVMVSASPLTDNSGELVGGVQSFQEIQEFFQRQLVMDNAFDGVVTVDMEYNITLFNKAAEHLTGYSQEEVLGKPYADIFYSPKRKAAIQSPLKKAILEGNPVVEESIYFKTASGDILPASVRAAPLADAQGTLLGGVMTFRDVTDQIQYRYILDSVTDGVFTVDQDLKITSFNKALEKITGYTQEEALAKKCREIFQTELCETENCPMVQSISSEGCSAVHNTILKGKEGREIPVNVVSNILTDDQGEVIGAVETIRDLTEITELRRKLATVGETQTGILTRSPKMKRIMSVLPEFSKSDATILILGESGTGKELIAQSIHSQSNRSDNPFVAVNSGALPDTLLESELFGYKAGAFTDARKDRKGRFAAAEKGTLFLDEIGDISPAMQVKLLRVIQSKTFEPLGSNTPVKTDVRIIAATNRDLEAMVSEGTFREDLYYRLNVVKIDLPPLRERMEDIPLLVEHFVNKFNQQRNRNVEGVSEAVLSILLHHDYPGNIRELENIIEYTFILCHEGLILPGHLPEWLKAGKEVDHIVAGPLTLKDVERKAIIESLRRNEFRKMKTCRELGISKDTLRRKIAAYKISEEEVNE